MSTYTVREFEIADDATALQRASDFITPLISIESGGTLTSLSLTQRSGNVILTAILNAGDGWATNGGTVIFKLVDLHEADVQQQVLNWINANQSGTEIIAPMKMFAFAHSNTVFLLICALRTSAVGNTPVEYDLQIIDGSLGNIETFLQDKRASLPLYSIVYGSDVMITGYSTDTTSGLVHLALTGNTL